MRQLVGGERAVKAKHTAAKVSRPLSDVGTVPPNGVPLTARFADVDLLLACLLRLTNVSLLPKATTIVHIHRS